MSAAPDGARDSDANPNQSQGMRSAALSSPASLVSRLSRRSAHTASPEEAHDRASGIRYVDLNNAPANAARNYISNQLRTAKYNIVNIIPKALFEQFRRVANFYFLVIAIISFIPDVSPSSPFANVIPLFVVVGFGFARDVYEDSQRSREDRRQNSERRVILARAPASDDQTNKGLSLLPNSAVAALSTLMLDTNLHRTVASRDIAVGDMALVRKGEVFPADMVLVYSAGEGGVAYVSTANLDGESNLKRVIVASCAANIERPSDLCAVSGRLRAQAPTTALHEFEATMSLNAGEYVPLDSSNLMLRGSILRNTDYVYGVVVYTGFDTKVALNMRNPPSKLGEIERKINQTVLFLFGVLALLVISSSIASGVLQGRQGPGQWYMGENATFSGRSAGFRGLGTFVILFSTFIPVSLFVTLEFIRVLQALFMSADFRMKTGTQSVVARATNLNETLGEVEHILSDKTGTLTENIMNYVACSAGGEMYNTLRKKSAMRKAVDRKVEPVLELVLAMALCHSVVPEPKADSEDPDVQDAGEKGAEDDLPEYQGQSPDEVALVTSAREYGIALTRRTLDTLDITRYGVPETYTALAELEFNSDRKRMSLILRMPNGKIRMYTKGADTIMLPLVNKDTDLETVQNHIDEFAKEGLRTLVFARKDLSEEEFNEWFARFQDARNSLEGRDEKVSEVSAEIEQDLEYIATTAVEDKLQDRVPETIKYMREAGIKLWVLTGDKRETAENIGYSANLLDRQMDVVHIKGRSSKEIEAQLQQTLDRHIGDEELQQTIGVSRVPSMTSLRGREERKVKEKELGIIIDGASLHFAIEEHSQLFMALADHTKVVICARVTPLQKALVVRLVREVRQSITLAVGDGGNDVSMIQEAHIGVGIFGKEGTQAARSADYAIGEFKHLLRLTQLHGRYSGVRTAGVINLSFYKNIFFTMTQVFFQIFCFASGTTYNNQWVTSAFNVVVTSATPFLYGIFERDLDENTVMRFPSSYAANRERKVFSLRTVIEYTMIYGLWHSVVVFFGVYLAFGYLRIDFRNGQDSGFFLVGFVSSTLIVLMSLAKMMLHSHTLNWIVVLCVALSVAMHFLVVPLAIYIPLADDRTLEGQIEMMFSSPTFYLAAFVIMAAGFMVDFAALMWRQLRRPNLVDTLQRWERQQRRKRLY